MVDAGQPFGAIVDRAEKEGVDLIVMSSHGRSGLSRMLIGSVTDKILRGGSCPVLVVPDKHGMSGKGEYSQVTLSRTQRVAPDRPWVHMAMKLTGFFRARVVISSAPTDYRSNIFQAVLLDLFDFFAS